MSTYLMPQTVIASLASGVINMAKGAYESELSPTVKVMRKLVKSLELKGVPRKEAAFELYSALRKANIDEYNSSYPDSKIHRDESVTFKSRDFPDTNRDSNFFVPPTEEGAKFLLVALSAVLNNSSEISLNGKSVTDEFKDTIPDLSEALMSYYNPVQEDILHSELSRILSSAMVNGDNVFGLDRAFSNFVSPLRMAMNSDTSFSGVPLNITFEPSDLLMNLYTQIGDSQLKIPVRYNIISSKDDLKSHTLYNTQGYVTQRDVPTFTVKDASKLSHVLKRIIDKLDKTAPHKIKEYSGDVVDTSDVIELQNKIKNVQTRCNNNVMKQLASNFSIDKTFAENRREHLDSRIRDGHVYFVCPLPSSGKVEIKEGDVLKNMPFFEKESDAALYANKYGGFVNESVVTRTLFKELKLDNLLKDSFVEYELDNAYTDTLNEINSFSVTESIHAMLHKIANVFPDIDVTKPTREKLIDAIDGFLPTFIEEFKKIYDIEKISLDAQKRAGISQLEPNPLDQSIAMQTREANISPTRKI
ncbi:MAG: hypothetical protein HAW67_02945 [Endozoicomonadaceae bacterium]|nr:hypothetical protein [Endozoicomonadaceae bacterium]